MTYLLANLLNMKIRPTSTRPQIFKHYEHPWYKHLSKPHPPTEEDVKKAKFIDKTFAWRNDARI